MLRHPDKDSDPDSHTDAGLHGVAFSDEDSERNANAGLFLDSDSDSDAYSNSD